MYQTDVEIRVRYSETDQMGYVYYGNYAAYFEVARTEAFRRLGIHYKEMEADGVMMPVLELKTKFIRPAKYDDLLTIRLFLKQYPTGARILFEYEVFNEAQELLTIGETTMVFVDMKTGRPTPTPQEIQQTMAPYFADGVTR
ncbi:acyl-CoA thioesterase [Adhaeribacter sp. BT258]|uniref:Acyl-CoA thioesterase n=1 Tax=Adhaeribacter terrigena TaxID=2793070 RepID=A0ABS1BXD7_9BACT|nr:thioesterase family protein [Adhaeribacter terrigena]MBK0401800.1 acyl-CoA thioesterase [Adhaeribacter terrigena]